MHITVLEACTIPSAIASLLSSLGSMLASSSALLCPQEAGLIISDLIFSQYTSRFSAMVALQLSKRVRRMKIRR